MGKNAYRSRTDKCYEVQRKDGYGGNWVPVFHTDKFSVGTRKEMSAIDYIKNNRLANIEFRIVDEIGECGNVPNISNATVEESEEM